EAARSARCGRGAVPRARRALVAGGRGDQGRGGRPRDGGDRRVRAQVVATRAPQPSRPADEGASALRTGSRGGVGAPPRVTRAPTGELRNRCGRRSRVTFAGWRG